MASWKEWWEFFSDRDVKAMWIAVMVMCWVLVLSLMFAFDMLNKDAPPSNTETEIGVVE